MSIHADLLDWAVAQIVALNLVPSSAVKKRKRPVRVKDDAGTFIVVSPGDEKLVSRNTGGYAQLDFPIHVCIIQQNSQAYGDPTWLLDARAAIRAALLNPHPLANVRQTSYDPNPILPLDGFAEGFDVSPQTFTFQGSELISRGL